MKYLLAVLMMGLLSACSLGATSPSEQPLESIGQSESMAPSDGMSTDESMMASPSESAAASGMTSMSCDDAWHSIDVMDVQSIGDLDAVASQLNRTFEDCGSATDWLSAAESALPSLDTTELRTWAETQCSVDDTLSQTPVCAELMS